MVGIPESFYHYHIKQLKRENKNRGLIVNHKKVQRIMRKLGLKGSQFTRKSHRYSSYKGGQWYRCEKPHSQTVQDPNPLSEADHGYYGIQVFGWTKTLSKSNNGYV